MEKVTVTAKSAKERADEINTEQANAQLLVITNLIKEAANRGEYKTTYSKKLMDETRNYLISAGFEVETGGRMNEIENNISWVKPVPPAEPAPAPLKYFYKNGIIGKGLMSESQYRTYVNTIIDRFENVCWGGQGAKHWSTDFCDVVVVYEAGIKGPADWFYLNNEHKWAHGGYSAYKETYTNNEFLEMIVKTLAHNKEYEKTSSESSK